MARYQLITLHSTDGRVCGILSEHHTFKAAASAARKLKAWAQRNDIGSGNAVIRDTLDRSVMTDGATRIPRGEWPAGIETAARLA